MNKVHKIVLKNFKFFFGEIELNLDSKNIILYGENGSGKSSIYWALYTFLQSVFKTDDAEVRKYFDHDHDQSLVNRFAALGEDSKIVIEFIDETKTITTKEISYGINNTKAGSIVKEAADSSDFINYRVLSGFYNFSNRDEIDLFSFFEDEVLMFLSFTREFTPGRRNALDWWKYLKPGMQPRSRMRDPQYGEFVSKIDEFNEELSTYVFKILETANEYLQNKFKQNLKLILSYKNCTYDDFVEGSTTTRSHITTAPKIIMSVEYLHDNLGGSKKDIRRPQSFLNEARLTCIALSIRFAILDEKYIDTAPKILVLDDLLISLDMSNRDIVLELILKEFSEYQIAILTHDRMFFELAKHKVKRLDQTKWVYYEMYESENDGVPQPFITASKSYLSKAKSFFYRKEYEVAGNFLRKHAESFCKEFLPKRRRFTPDFEPYDLNGLINQVVNFAKENNLETDVFDALDGHRKFVLNPASHDSYDIEKFNHEIQKCIDTFDVLREIICTSSIPKGTKLNFELVNDRDGAVYHFEIELQESMMLIKQPGKESVLTKAMIYFVVSIDGTPTTVERQTGNETLKGFYDKNYRHSNKAKTNNFWEEILLSESGQNISSLREY